MKKSLFIITLLLGGFITAQSSEGLKLNEVFSQYIQPKSSVSELREGLEKVEKLCAITPQEKCNKAKATALYLLSDKYYGAAYQVIIIDSTLAQPVLTKANDLYKKANALKPINEFAETQKNMLLENKHYFEAFLKAK